MCQRIDKRFLDNRDICEIKNDCFVEGKVNDYGPPDTLRAYGETNTAMYVPFAYAKKRFKESPNKDTKFPQTNYKFHSDKFPFRTDGGRDQEVVFKESIQLIKKYRSVLLSLFCGYGKCLGKDTPILMYDGTIKMVQDVQVGDLLMGDDSTPRRVLTLARGEEELFKVVPTKGEPYVVNRSHILSLYISGNKQIMRFNKNNKHIGWTVKWFDHEKLNLRTKNFYNTVFGDENQSLAAAKEFVLNIDSPNTIDISVVDYLSLPKSFHGPAGMLLGYKVHVMYETKPYKMDPYMLGYWLGDGVSIFPKITTVDEPILDYFSAKLKEDNLYLSQNKSDPITYTIRGDGTVGNNVFWNALKEYDLVGNKHIPHDYKTNSFNVRLQVLAGLLDADGHLAGNCFEIVQKNKTLANDIVYIARSLGFAAYMKTCEKTCTNGKKGPVTGTYYRTIISGNTDIIPTKLDRKKATPRKQIKNHLVTRIKLESIGVGDYYGFTIDGNHRFVLGDFTVTHNTFSGIKLAHSSKLKCAVLAHRGVLFDQWVESIEKFTTAKVQIVETDGVLDPDADFYIFNIAFVHKRWNKSTKSWVPKKLGIYKDTIGMLIVDEAHVACASEMSRALLYFNPRIAVALTATPQREDGMDKALELYFGEYKTTRIIRIAQDPFTVYRLPTGIKPAFTRNAFGKKDWNSVITSLIENETRNKLIIDLIKKFSTFTILVLTKRKTHCDILAKELKKLGITNTVMTGTTKKYDKTARVLLSTYSKLGVGFDDGRLNMLIVACSVKQVEQYAGRLRDSAGKKRVVIDLVDSDPNCQSHWSERRKWYISRNGDIKHYYKSFPKEKSPSPDISPEPGTERKRLARKI